MIDLGSPVPFVFNNCIAIKDAANHCGYNIQYLRRLLRDGRLTGKKLGQTWLIDKSKFESYLENANHKQDKRLGSKWFFAWVWFMVSLIEYS